MVAFSWPVWADVIELPAVLDNTLYSESGDLSNGGGQHFLCGRAGPGGVRRALIQFDLAAIPAGATIESVALTLNLSQTSTGPTSASLHRLLESWGEGTADASGGEGGGAPATTGDATWRHRFYAQNDWSSEGGLFVATPSATETVEGLGVYAWSAAEMVGDAQGWLDAPQTNFGWILIGDESGPTSGKRFDSRQNPVEGVRPRLTFQFVLPCPGDVNGDGMVELADLARVLSMFGTQCGPACPEDLDGDGDVDLADLAALLGRFGAVCF
jgi:hypothetical protein